MEWKFWKRNKTDQANTESRLVKLQGPKELPQLLGQYLVTHEKMEPDWVWSLKCVLRRHPDQKSEFDCRIFSPNQISIHNFRVVDYTSLDDHPELILFQGWFNSQSNQVKIQKGAPELAA